MCGQLTLWLLFLILDDFLLAWILSSDSISTYLLLATLVHDITER